MSRRHLPSLAGLQCFEAAARHLSFTRAADELSLTQSAVSKQVAQLESILEHPLFRRIRRRLHLTPEGAIYLGEARKILAQVEMSTRYMQSYGGEADVLNVATLPTFGARWLIPRLNGFRFRHPNINLNISNRVEPFDMQQERVEVAFFFGHGAWPKAECIRLLEEEIVPVCSPQALEGMRVEEPLALTRLVLLQSATRPEAWHDWFDAQGQYTEHSYHGPRFDTFYMALRAAQAGCGVALVPRFLVQEEIDEGKLVVPWPFSLKSRDAYYMAYPEHMADLYKVRAFIDWIRERIV
ncbi:transcriptional regulator GcvA [Halomonas sp. MCCC 1A17488]|uniref:Transcriptional regulator GcvA n=1 Tax=Billgrantia sulfidoxydans TaxID=2733484 RepID=A0ABX7W7B9_9GAMM|nr:MULTISPECIES: transcriptional regulator GcvA [Halomonas]MCE8015334.1 transcriptional regulator GcvA [Halomonas sp. MCCC 1A17488]MCG3238667.1 transcriptional regulator GcvA [Halomonas sp. MCCC 1A17488]QPP51359.1 transcriptional regulator GcvA [Halomonas sp. SS10-MC5]QTP54913.1 transcriptional regulator GcvA [Halomonas sulfidoxydans]